MAVISWRPAIFEEEIKAEWIRKRGLGVCVGELEGVEELFFGCIV